VTLSFRSRLTLRWVFAFGLVLALATLVVYVGGRRFLLQDFDAQLRTLAGTELASAIDEPGHGPHLHEFPIDPNSTKEYADKFVQLLDPHGRVLLQSASLGHAGSFLDQTTLSEALAGDAPLVDVTVRGRSGRMIALVTEGADRFVVAVGLFTGELDVTLRRLRNLLVGVWIGALALTAVIGFSLASSALAPINRITAKATTIAEGQFAARLDPPQVDDEIGRMTRLLNQMLDRLHAALEANRRFAADASHELRGPLTAMLGEIDVAIKRDRSPAEYREVLHLLRGRLQVMIDLTQDLMLLVRAQENVPAVVREVRVRDLLRRAVERSADAAAANRLTITDSVPPELVIYGEAGLLERVFDNVLGNAIQYNAEGGRVEVAARLVPSQGEWVADQVLIEVRNTGASIPAADRERVFERFYRVDPSRSRRTGGAGLGLAISREIVQLFKGDIRVAESSGAGTTIEIRLPGGSAAS